MLTVIRILGVLATVGLQVTMFGHWRPLGVMPELLLIVIVLAAITLSATTTLAMAIGGGLLLDVASGADFGLRTGFMAAMALAVIAVRQFGLHVDSVLTALAITGVSTALFNLAVVTSARAELVDWRFVASQTLRQVILNMLIMALALVVRGLIRDRRARVTSELRRGSWI